MLKKLAIYYSFIITSVMVGLGFFGARSVPELISAVLFFPLGVYFTLLVLPRKRHAMPVLIEEEKGHVVKPVKEVKSTDFDPERRKFLKLIGGAGLTLFLFSVFTKKTQAAFFGSVPGPGTVSIKDSLGTQIDPAEKQPTDGYRISETEDAGANFYTGYINKTGAWYIIREDSSGSYRYAKGASGYSTNWTNRASLSYDYFDAVF